jgi:phospholipid transport system substrate-binding protein
MTQRRIAWAALAMIAWGMALAFAPRVTAAQQSPIDAVRSRNEAVQKILDVTGDSVSGPEREQLKDVINGLIDFPELAKRALGKYWKDRTEAERTEFTEVFRELVRNSSVRKLGIHQADSLTYLPPEITDDGATLTTIAHKGRKSLEIVYRMTRKGETWKAWDVIIDGSSTMRTYRDSFYREIASNSFEAMLTRLKDKLAEEGGLPSPDR